MRELIRIFGIAIAGLCALGPSPAWAPLVDDPYHPATKIPCEHQRAFPSKAECPKEHAAFLRMMERHPPRKRDRLREIEDRLQELELRLEQRR